MKNTFKRVLSLLLMLCMLASLAAVPVFAEELESITDINISSYSKIYFKGETNKDFATYEVGEEMIFTFTLYADDKQISAPYFKCTVSGDDGKSSTEYHSATSGSVTLTTSVSVAGGVRVVVEPADWSKNVISADNITKFEGGAIAGADTVQTTVAEPLDFDEFWAGKLAELDECAPDLYSIEPITSTNENYDAYIVKVNCIGDPSMIKTNATWTAGVISVPKNVAAGSLGFRLDFQGYGASSAGQSNNWGYVTFTVCAHSIEQLQDASYYNRGNLGLTEYGWSEDENADPATSYFTHMLMRDVQAVRFLKKYFGPEGGEETFGGVNTGAWKGLWNGSTIYVSGSSQGGFQAISVAALVPEVTKVYANVPWFADVAGNTVPTRIQSTFRPPYADGLRYLDTALMAKRVKADVVMIEAGTGDALCPMYAVQAIYNNMNTNVSFTFTQGKCHSGTNTYPIYSTQEKVATTESRFGKDALVVYSLELLGEGFGEELASAWRRLTGRDAVIYDDKSAPIEEDSIIVIEMLTLEEAKEIDVSQESMEQQISDNGIDFFGVLLMGESDGPLSESVKMLLRANADKNSPINVVGFGQSTVDAGVLAEVVSGAYYGNQPSTDVSYRIIDGNGNECSTFVTSDDLSSAEVYPIAYPYHATKKAELVTSYAPPSETGADYGIITVSGVGLSKKINVYDSALVTASGKDSGCEWIVLGGDLHIFGDAVSDTEYDWNSAISGVTKIVVNEGVTSLGAGAFDVPTGATVVLPLSLDAIDASAFCGKTDFTISAYANSVGNVFADENGINFESLGMANKCGEDVYWSFADKTLTIFGSGSTVVSGINGYGNEESSVFYEYYNDIEKVVITGDITTLGATAFHFMTNLKTVELSPKVTTLNQAVFEICSKLDTIYVTGNEPVKGTADLSYITSFTNGYIFDGVHNISNFILSDELSGSIKLETFKKTAIKDITIPEKVTSIDTTAFAGVSTIENVTVLGKNTTISTLAFWDKNNDENYIDQVTIIAYEDSAAHGFAKSNYIKYKNIETGEVIDYSTYFDGEAVLSGNICDGASFHVARIGDTDTYELTIMATGASVDGAVTDPSALPYAEYADKIVSAKIFGTAESVGDYILADMSDLTTVEISGSITDLGNGVFENSGVKTIYIKDTDPVEGTANLVSIKSFGKSCFAGTAIEALQLSGSITSIPEKAFMGSGLLSIELSNKIDTIEADAFKNCASLASVSFAAKQFTIASGAFAGLAEGAVIKAYEATDAEEMAELYGYIFDSMGEIPHTIEGEIKGSYWDNTWVFDEYTKVLTISSKISGGYNEVGPISSDPALSKIIKIVEEVVLVGNMDKLSGSVFLGATNLRKVTIPATLAQINHSAFKNCTNLTTIAVEGQPEMEGVVNFSCANGDSNGKNSLSAGNDIFKGATSVKGIILGSVYSDSNPLVASNLPDNLETIYGNTEYLEKYCEENGYNFVPFGKDTTSKAYWTINTEAQTLTLFGSGTVSGLENTIARYADNVQHVIVDSGIEGFGNGALSSLTALKDVKFMGDAPSVPQGAKPFGARDAAFRVIVKSSASGFEGDTWCGYTLTKLNYIAGDINEDEAVNTKDAVLLAQHLAGWEVTIHALAADCNGDGSINTKDAVLLAQCLAGWDVELEGGIPPAPENPEKPEIPGEESGDNEVDFGQIKSN